MEDSYLVLYDEYITNLYEEENDKNFMTKDLKC